MNLEELARQAGYDVDPKGITMPIYHADGPADERAHLARFAAIVLEGAAKKVASMWEVDGQASADEFAAAIRELKPGTAGQEPDDAAEDLYDRLHSLSKSLESSGRLDEHDNPGAYATVLDAMNYVRRGTVAT